MRHLVQGVLALACAAGAALCWGQVTSVVDVAPVIDGQPATVSVVYNPPMLLTVWLLCTLAGVLGVLAVAGWRRTRP